MAIQPSPNKEVGVAIQISKKIASIRPNNIRTDYPSSLVFYLYHSGGERLVLSIPNSSAQVFSKAAPRPQSG
jgi:hypothetical protein